MRTRFTGITDQDKDQRKLIRMEAYRALLSLKEEPPAWDYSGLKFHNDDEVIADFIVSDDDPRVMVRFYNCEYNCEFNCDLNCESNCDLNCDLNCEANCESNCEASGISFNFMSIPF